MSTQANDTCSDHESDEITSMNEIQKQPVQEIQEDSLIVDISEDPLEKRWKESDHLERLEEKLEEKLEGK